MLIALLALLLPPLHAEITQQFHIENYVQQRQLNQAGYSARDTLTEDYLLTDYLFQYSGRSFFFEAKPQIRAVESPGVQSVGPEQTSVTTSSRVFNSRRTLSRQDSHDVEIDFDRLNMRYGDKSGEVFVGRRPLSLGVLRFFPVWNKLTLPLIFEPGPEWVENPDVIGGSIQYDHFSTRVFAARGDRPQVDDLILSEWKYFGENLEAQLLVGSWWQRSALGVALSTDWLEATWRLEALGLSRTDSERSQGQLGLGFERALNSKWTLIAEYLGQSLCRTRSEGYGATPPSRFQILSGCQYVLPFVTVQANSEWRLGAGSLINLGDGSTVAILSADYAWNDSLSFQLKGKWAIGAGRSEFGPAHFTDPLGREAGAQSTVFAGFSLTL